MLAKSRTDSDSGRNADPARCDIVVEGDLRARDAKVTFSRDGKVRAVATVFRDLDSLRAEVEIERAHAVAHG